jgi:hypothetical protein
MIFDFDQVQPNPFDTVETWERYLAQLRQMPDQDDPMMVIEIAHAEDFIERKRAS